jgi:hypothetical protein
MEGGSKRGRYRLSWLKDVKKDLWEMKVKGWQYETVDRQ